RCSAWPISARPAARASAASRTCARRTSCTRASSSPARATAPPAAPATATAAPPGYAASSPPPTCATTSGAWASPTTSASAAADRFTVRGRAALLQVVLDPAQRVVGVLARVGRVLLGAGGALARVGLDDALVLQGLSHPVPRRRLGRVRVGLYLLALLVA